MSVASGCFVIAAFFGGFLVGFALRAFYRDEKWWKQPIDEALK